MKAAERKKLEAIARKHIPPVHDRGDLKPRYNDDEDFLDVAVWCLLDALAAAYELGKAEATNRKEG